MFKESNFALLLLTTEKEYNQGSVKSCLDSYIKVLPKDHKLDIVIFIDTISSPLNLGGYAENIKINAFPLMMLPEDNIYYRSAPENFQNPPRLGLSHGPNFLFFEAFKIIKKLAYKNVLLIESDTKAVCSSDLWIDTVNEYIKKEDFIIAGSTYKGSVDIQGKYWENHLNGVAIYKNNETLHEILSGAEKYIEKNIKKYNYRLNFDVAIDLYLNDFPEQRVLYKDADFIVNVSHPFDANQSTIEILMAHPNAKIIHKKNL